MPLGHNHGRRTPCASPPLPPLLLSPRAAARRLRPLRLGISEQELSQSGLRITTTIDPARQAAAVDAAHAGLAGQPADLRSAMVAVDPQTGGVLAYYGGDNLKLIASHPERIGYLHLKQVDTDLLFDVLKNDVPFGDAVAQGVMVEPPHGVPDLAPVLDAVSRIDPEIFAIVEQDMFPVESIDLPLGIATRTREHIMSCSPRSRLV